MLDEKSACITLHLFWLGGVCKLCVYFINEDLWKNKKYSIGD